MAKKRLSRNEFEAYVKQEIKVDGAVRRVGDTIETAELLQKLWLERGIECIYEELVEVLDKFVDERLLTPLLVSGYMIR